MILRKFFADPDFWLESQLSIEIKPCFGFGLYARWHGWEGQGRTFCFSRTTDNAHRMEPFKAVIDIGLPFGWAQIHMLRFVIDSLPVEYDED